MKAAVVFMLFSLTIAPAAVSGQTASSQQSVFDSYLNPERDASLLYIPGLEFHSSVGFAYSTSNSLGSAGMGYYLGHFRWKLTGSLSLNWDVGIRSVMTGGDPYSQPELFLPNVDLTYRPNSNVMVRLQFQQYGPGPYLMRRSWY
jgi:hypothetical protein